MATSWTEDDLLRINRAIASGTTRVQLEGRVVETRSLDDLIKIRNMIRADLGQIEGGASGFQYFRHDKGLT